MSFNNRKSCIINLALILALIGQLFSAVPVRGAALGAIDTSRSIDLLQENTIGGLFKESGGGIPQSQIIFPTVVTTSPQHGDVLSLGPSSILIQFSTDMLADNTAFSVNRTTNYLLVKDGEDGEFQTTSCAGVFSGDDSGIVVNAVTYSSTNYTSTLSVNGGASLNAGNYQLLVCGSTRINDLSGNKLNGGVDSIIRFLVVDIEYNFDPHIVNYDDGLYGYAVDIGDLNSDGFNDIAMTTHNQVIVNLQNNLGSLDAPIVYPAGSGSQAMAVGDLNNDGRDDVVTGDYYSNTVSVFIQQVDGTLATRIAYVTASQPDAIAIGDVTGDGLADIVLSHRDAPAVGVFPQNINGGFDPMVSYLSLRAGNDDIAIGDLNNDGRSDVVKMNGSGTTLNISIYLQNTDGTLAEAVSYSVCNCLGEAVEIGDVTGDGLSDVIISHGGNRPSSKIAIFAQGEDGLLPEPVYYDAYDIPSAVELVDINFDNALDVVTLHGAWSSLSVFLQQNGMLAPYTRYSVPTVTHPHPQSLAAGDINEDGAIDVAIAEQDGGLVVAYHHAMPMPQVVMGGNTSPLDGEELGAGINQAAVQFSRKMRADEGVAAVNNISNYLLVENGEDGIFQTSSCAMGITGDDAPVNIDNVEYNASKQYATLLINGGEPLDTGNYRLLVCRSIVEDDAGIKLNKGLLDSTIGFSVWPTPYTISGNAGVAGAVLNYVDGSSKIAIADGSGDYSFKVSENWSGTVTPIQAGYIFSPANMTYTNVSSDEIDQNYITTLAAYIISGNVGLADVRIEYFTGNYPHPVDFVLSDSNGDYSISVPYGWSGHINPYEKDHTFSPSGYDYADVTNDISNEDYAPIINPYTISGNTSVGGVNVTYTLAHSTEIVTSDENGNYSFTVGENWTGIVTPYKQGCVFMPVSKSFSNVQSNQLDQNFIAQRVYLISGNAGIAWAQLNYTEETPITIYANYLGDYSFLVPEDWSGTVTPSREGYTFSPANHIYTNVVADQPNQDYIANPISITISGNTGIAEVALNYFDGTAKTVISDNQGNYSFTVPYNWSGRITPSKNGYRFTPVSKTFTLLKTDKTNQEFVPERVYTISGNTGIPNVVLSYIQGTYKTVQSDNSGNYSFAVIHNWTGTVTPSKQGYTFTPVNRSYADLSLDQVNQDYIATAIYTVSGNVGAVGATLSYLEDGTSKAVTSDSNGNYSFVVKAGWSGTVTPSKLNVSFFPESRTYTDTQSEQSSQNYSATIWVTNSSDTGPGSLRQAVADTCSGATIRFASSLAGETITLASELNVNKDLIIDGSGLDPYVSISGNHTVRIFKLGSYTITIGSLILKDASKTGTPSSDYYGGAIYTTNDYDNTTNLTIKHVVFADNTAYQGGAIFVTGGTVTITESEFTNNTSEAAGGAIYVERGDLTIKDSLLKNNSASWSGGAISFASGMWHLVDNSTFFNNTAVTGGGAIFFDQRNNHDITIRNNLFTENSSIGNSGGGAIRITTPGGEGIQGILENNTFYANSAARSGGAIVSEGNWLFKNNTFSNNRINASGFDGASISLSGARTVLRNNIFANGIGGAECAALGGFTSGSVNLVEDGSSPCSTLWGTIISDPMLGTLADNGGSTYTMALQSGSPALDTGYNATCAETDQRGITRPHDGDHDGNAVCDIGAYEVTSLLTVSSIVRAGANPTSASSVDFVVTFSEKVTDVDAGDFLLSVTNLPGTAITGVSGSGTTYAVSVNIGIIGSVNGSIRLDVVDNDSIRDLAGNRLGGSGTGNGNFTTGQPYLIAGHVSKPVSLAPPSKYITNNPQPTFSWDSVINAAEYEIVFASDSGFTQSTPYFVTDPSFTPETPMADGKHYWRVRAYNLANEPGAWSSIRSLTIDVLEPAAPVLQSPVDGMTVRTVPTFRWKTVSGAVLYQFELDNNEDFSSPVVSVEQRTLYRKPSGGLRGTYYWRVKAKDAAGNWSEWSSVFTVTITRSR